MSPIICEQAAKQLARLRCALSLPLRSSALTPYTAVTASVCVGTWWLTAAQTRWQPQRLCVMEVFILRKIDANIAIGGNMRTSLRVDCDMTRSCGRLLTIVTRHCHGSGAQRRAA